MTLEIKTNVLQPRRQTYANVARRLGADKPASRYEEGTYDMQAEVNFHYRPTWDPKYKLFDASRTAIKMADWYSFKDPRQFYYGTYTIARSRMMESVEKNFAFFEKRGLAATINPSWTEKLKRYLIPLRHYEWGANMNNCQITDFGYGTAITQTAMFATMDRLGIAQLISRIGLMLDGNQGDSLTAGRHLWLEGPMWQGLRHAIEDSFVLDDWFEQFVAQNFALDGVIYPLVYQNFDREGLAHGGAAMSPLIEFMADWYEEETRWVDALLRVTAAESPENKALLQGWMKTWIKRGVAAFQPVAADVLGSKAEAAMAEAVAGLDGRARKIGIEL